jgi:hypothetical protein
MKGIFFVLVFAVLSSVPLSYSVGFDVDHQANSHPEANLMTQSDAPFQICQQQQMTPCQEACQHTYEQAVKACYDRFKGPNSACLSDAVSTMRSCKSSCGEGR